MNSMAKYPLTTAITFVWIGFVCAISFMEAWLKFRAPGMTLPLGLSVGKLVFNALNKVEWVFAGIILLNLLLSMGEILRPKVLWYFIPLLILIIQSIWLLPVLNARAEMFIQQKEVTPSNIHFYYVSMEVAKVVCLVGFGISLIRINN